MHDTCITASPHFSHTNVLIQKVPRFSSRSIFFRKKSSNVSSHVMWIVASFRLSGLISFVRWREVENSFLSSWISCTRVLLVKLHYQSFCHCIIRKRANIALLWHLFILYFHESEWNIFFLLFPSLSFLLALPLLFTFITEWIYMKKIIYRKIILSM